MSSNKYYLSVGFEVHVELKTKSKMFCGCSASYFGHAPNTQTCPICLGLPGALPVPNKQAIDWTILLGLALHCEINLQSRFDRKNYFYPDLAKGYQISQYEQPFCHHGYLEIAGKKIRINRVHLEEDTAKLSYAVIENGEVSLIDFNRSGVPLVEIVSEPDFHDLETVKAYLKELQRVIRYLGISDADMEKGTLRCEPSISLSTDLNKLADYRVEIKNINSFKFAEKAIIYEIKRQSEMLDQGVKPEQETRGYDENKNITLLQRSKENAEDYRYFPEPDIPPFIFNSEDIENIKKQLPELPEEKRKRFVKEFNLSDYEAGILCDTPTEAEKFEGLINDIKLTIARNAQKIKCTIADLPKEVAKLQINKKINLESPTIIDQTLEFLSVKDSGISETEIKKVIAEVLKTNKKAVEDYKSGKSQVLGFLTGLCMKRFSGKEEVKRVQECIIALLS